MGRGRDVDRQPRVRLGCPLGAHALLLTPHRTARRASADRRASTVPARAVLVARCTGFRSLWPSCS
jgi:hypothetical protein